MEHDDFYSLLSLFLKDLTLEEMKSWSGICPDFYDFKENLNKYLSKERQEKLKPSWFLELLDIKNYNYKNGIKILSPLSKAYPSDFFNLKKPPLYLSILGDINSLGKPILSVVGSRHPNLSVVEWMDKNLVEISNKGYVIASGAARGVDQRAHACAIRAEKPTIAFLPSGICHLYPENFIHWKSKIIENGGALISEYSPFQKVLPFHFHQRNRMIASIGLVTFICQAKRKSGSLLTANLAIENSKTICVLPSFPDDNLSQGSVDLLFQGAFPIRDHQDIEALLNIEKVKKQNSFLSLQEI